MKQTLTGGHLRKLELRVRLIEATKLLEDTQGAKSGQTIFRPLAPRALRMACVYFILLTRIFVLISKTIFGKTVFRHID